MSRMLDLIRWQLAQIALADAEASGNTARARDAALIECQLRARLTPTAAGRRRPAPFSAAPHNHQEAAA